MIANMNEKGRQTKLLAAVAILAMVVCVFAVVMPSDISAETDDATTTDSSVMSIAISESNGEIVYTKNGETYAPTMIGDTMILAGTNELTNITKVTVNMTGGTVSTPLAIVGQNDQTNNTYNGDIEFTMTGGTLAGGLYAAYTNGSSSGLTGTWASPNQMADEVVINISGGDVTAAIQPVINYLKVNSYTINVSGTADINIIKTAGSNGRIDTEVVNISGGSVGYITAQRSAVGTLTYNITGGSIEYFTIGADTEGANNGTNGANMQTGYVYGNVVVNIASAADVSETIVGGGILDMPKKNANGNTITDEMTGTVTINAPGKEIKLQNSFYDDDGKVKILYMYPSITTATVQTTAGYSMSDYWNGENVFGNAETPSRNLNVVAGTLVLPEGGQYYGKISIGTNTVDLSGITAGENGITFSQGSIVISGTIDTTNPVSIDVDGNVSIQGELTGADGLTVGVIEDGTANITLRDLVIPTGTTLSIVDGTEANPVTVTVSKSSTVQVDGTLDLGDYVNMDSKGSVTSSTGKGVINTTATSSVEFSGPMIGVAGDGNIINNNSSWSTITLNDGAEINAQTSIIASSTQEIVIAGDVTVVAGGVIDMSGKLTINEGATLTLEEGAKIIVNNMGIVTVNGDLVIEKGAASAETFIYNGSEMTVAGTVDIQGVDAFICNGPVSVSGTMNIGEDASANFTAGLTIANGGNLNIDGVAKGKVTNNGTVTIDTEVSGNDLDIQMGNGAVLDIVSLVGTVDVSDSETPYTIQGVKYTIGADKANIMTFTDVSGVKISETLEIKTDKNGDRYAVNSTFISGAVGQAKDASGNALTTASIEISAGTVQVTDTLDLGKIAFSVGVGGTLKVSGTINAIENEITTDKKMVISGKGTIDVTGSIKTLNAITTTKVNAAHYTVKEGTVEYNYYSTLGAAIAANADDIDILGALVIDSDVTIPAGTIVSATDKTDSILIKENATVTVAFTDGTSGKFDNGTVEIEVEGTLITENLRKSAVNENYVISDVATKNGDAAQFTNIYKALDDAQAGDKVTITKNGNITLNKDISVKSGVTLVIPEESGIIVDNGMTVTVDGTLENNGTYTINKAIEDDPETTGVNEAKGAGATVVNGLFKTVSSDQYTAQIAGAYFVYDDMDCIAPLSFVAENIGDLESDATIYGDVTVEDITLTYTGEDAFTLTVDASANFTAGTINLDNVAFNFNGRTNATIVIAEGTFVLKDVAGGNITDVITYNADNTENHVATLSGAVKNATTVEDETTVYLDGSVSVSGTADIANVISVDFEVDVIIAEGATVGVSNTKFADASVFNAGKTDSNMVTVNGTMVIESTNVSFDSITVSGTVSVAADQKYTATVNDALYAGVSVAVKDGKKIVTDLGTGAVIDGLVLGSSATAYASSSATVGASIVDSQGMKSTVYYVDDAVYVTAYTKDSVDIDSIVANVTDARFNGWVNADKEPATTYDSDGKVVTSEDIGAIGFTEVYADIDYNVYTVSIRTDGGIGSVAIDGNLMTNNGGNTFTMSGLTAGEHKVTYTLKNGFQGEAVLSSSDLAVSGNTFTLTGDFDTTYVLNLAGTEPADQTIVIEGGNNGGSDSLGLTDYLLIILVILIVIMAIIVASRMMRS